MGVTRTLPVERILKRTSDSAPTTTLRTRDLVPIGTAHPGYGRRHSFLAPGRGAASGDDATADDRVSG